LSPAVVGAQIHVESEHQRGLALRAQGRHAEAAAVFRALYESIQEPRALVRLTLAEAAAFVDAMTRSPVEAFRWTVAEEHLQTARALAGDPYVRTAAVRNALQQTHDALQGQLGFLEIACATPGTEVWAGTSRVATLPLQHALRAPVGQYSLSLRAPGFAPRSVPVTVGAGLIVAVEVSLTPLAATTPVVSHEAAMAPASSDTPLVTRDERAPSRPRPTQRIVGWTLLGVGAVAGAVGVLYWVESAQNLSALQDATGDAEAPYGAWARFNAEQNPAGTLPASEVCSRAESVAGADAQSVVSLCRSSATTDALALGLGLGGVAVALVGGVLLGTAPRVPRRLAGALPTVQPWSPRAATRGLSLGWSF